MRPASAHHQRAAIHSLDKQLVLGDCLAQHRRMHSYVQSLQCQSELQRSQLIDLHGHATLAAALQRAFCSEVKPEEIGLLCLVFGMDVPCVTTQLGVASQLNLKCCSCHPSIELLDSSRRGRAKDRGCAPCDGEAWGARAITASADLICCCLGSPSGLLYGAAQPHSRHLMQCCRWQAM